MACFIISTRTEGQATFRLVAYDESFWGVVKEVCTITEPLVRVLHLVDGEKPAMGYTYMRPWIGPKNPSMLIMRTREIMGRKDNI